MLHASSLQEAPPSNEDPGPPVAAAADIQPANKLFGKLTKMTAERDAAVVTVAQLTAEIQAAKLVEMKTITEMNEFIALLQMQVDAATAQLNDKESHIHPVTHKSVVSDLETQIESFSSKLSEKSGHIHPAAHGELLQELQLGHEAATTTMQREIDDLREQVRQLSVRKTNALVSYLHLQG